MDLAFRLADWPYSMARIPAFKDRNGLTVLLDLAPVDGWLVLGPAKDTRATVDEAQG